MLLSELLTVGHGTSRAKREALRTITWCFVLVLLAALGPGPAVRAAESEDELLDANQYAKAYDVSLGEAVARLARQSAVGDLGSILESEEPDSYGGLFIEHVPTYRVVLQFTTDEEAIAAEYLKGADFADYVEVRHVARTLAELEKDLADLRDTLGEGPYVADVDVTTNRLRISVSSEATWDSFARDKGFALPAEATIVNVAELPSPAISLYGGLWFYEPPSTSAGCTSGFTVVRQYVPGGRAVTTAGHCSNTMTALLDGVGHFPLAYSGDEHRSGSHDEQSHLRNASDSYPNKIVDGAGGDDVRNITAKRPRSVQQVGDWVCHYGRVTDYECGTIVTKTITPCGGVGTPSSTGIQVHNPNNVDLAQGGDSGGPWFFGPAADGTLSCQFGLDGIYVAINYIESGLDVLLATN